jgi:hypothetical protein
MRNILSSRSDTIDMRDVAERIEELEFERGEFNSSIERAKENSANEDEGEDAVLDAELALNDWDADNADELKALQSLADECGSDTTLINEEYFEQYAQETAESMNGSVYNDWPENCIDWKQAAEVLQSDYSSVDFEGTTFYYSN